MIERDSICCSSVFDFDDPSQSQYSGRLLEGCSDSSNENSGSMLKVVVPVSDERSSSFSWILPNGDKNLSLSMFNFQSCQLFLIRTWSDLLIIFAPSLIANSCRLIFNGLMPCSASSASLLLVGYESRHKHRAFLCTSSNN